MSVRASVFETIFSHAGAAWPLAVLLAPLLVVVAAWNRCYRHVRVSNVSTDWLERHKREAPKGW